MKNLIRIPYILFFLLSATSLIAQPDWQWGQEVRFNARNIAVDNYGNSYVTWSLQDNYEIDGELFISNGLADIALTSFDCAGNHRWTKTFGGQSSDVASYVGTDTLGGVYLVGRFSAMGNYDVNISNDTVISGYTNKGFFLTKYDSQGDFQWFQMPEDTAIIDITNIQLAGPLDMEVSPNGDCYIYSKLPPGTYGNGAYETTQEGTSNGSDNLHILKYDRNGNCTGGFHLDVYYSGSFLFSNRLTRDHHTGKFYMSGYLSDEDNIVIFGGEEVTAENYVVQFDSSGFVNWRISTDDSFPGTSGQSGFAGKPSVDEFGNVYVAGGSGNGFSFGDFTFENTLGPQGFPIFAKIDSMGNVVYATNASTNVGCDGKATAYSNNKVAVTGNWGSLITWGDVGEDITGGDSQGYNVFLALFDASGDGLPESFHSLTSSPVGVEIPSILTADNQGNFYVGGHFSGQLHVGDGTLYNQTGTQEGFIAKFGTDSCYCPLPTVLFTYDTIPNQAGYNFAYTGSTDADSVIWDFGDGQTGSGFNPYHFFAESGIYTVCATAFNQCGADSVCITIDALGPVGIKAINGFEEIRVYPNPAHEVVYINNASPGTRIDVINAVGQNLGSSILQSNNAKINVSSLPSSVYLLQFTGSDGKMGYARFVKE
ncbi:T9SS type A sorting domain-containing protein [Cryomorpha ignava]|uniref:T9SS type A sorting domain-containing protein n=1 Tax=Cryomorpha ignava TaxID=101383 RepID=A0A7K3WVU8_9FLAO|nr:PKD domain-containing protein [Cryomorpha ignava]NEN25634.1 T9SS type A sorting domain-containing protein [Cryomorpha ignava]